MDLLAAAFFGLLQGLTEWFPISSSGHFVVAQHFLSTDGVPFSFDITLHAATLLVLLLFFRKDIWKILKTAGDIVKDLARGEKLARSIRKTDDRMFAALVLVAMIPTGIIGLLVDLYITNRYMQSLLPVGIAFIIQGCLVLSTKFGKGTRRLSDMNSKDALAIGTMQGLASLSGLSRSGSTISIGVGRGLDQTSAARFSFIVAIPAYLAALLLHIRDIGGIDSIGMTALAVGFATAFVVGLLTLKGLMYILRGTRFHYFAIYSFLFGCTIIALFVMGF
jgi:undecaprenyl-diphosphatase